MAYRDILAVVASSTADAAVLDFSQQLADQEGGVASALVLGWIPTVSFTSEAWVADPWWGELYQKASNDLDQEAAKIKERLGGKDQAGVTEKALIEAGATKSTTALCTMHSDVAVVGLPAGAPSTTRSILEGALFESGRPVFIVPPTWKRRPIGRSVIIAWKPSREAARALADAEPLLARADKITIVTVDAKPSEDGFGPVPGGDITAHLARKGYKPELVNIASAGRTQAGALMDHARTIGADVVVMGGYGRSRLSEFLLGGVTHDILLEANLPILMSH